MFRSTLVTMATVLCLPACTATPAGSTLPSQCEAIEVDPTRELVVTDPSIVGCSCFDFAHVMGAVLGPQSNAAAKAWMDAWAATPGEATLASEVTQPWAASSTDGLDLKTAPFELIAIVNRIDLTTQQRPAELRFVYGLVSSGTPQPMTVNVELQLPPTSTTAQWATTWHALGSLTGDAELEALTAIAQTVLGTPLQGQVRTQDARLTTPILHEFDIVDGAPLVPSPLFNQPAQGVRSADLAAFIHANEDAVMADEAVLPKAMLAPAIEAVAPGFDVPDVSPDLMAAFTDNTCSGCHTSEPTIDGAFHISPLRRGQAALSTFLVGSDEQPSELARRAEVLRGLLCH